MPELNTSRLHVSLRELLFSQQSPVDFRFGSFSTELRCLRHVRFWGNSGNAGRSSTRHPSGPGCLRRPLRTTGRAFHQRQAVGYTATEKFEQGARRHKMFAHAAMSMSLTNKI
jgi:hypothetical protein